MRHLKIKFSIPAFFAGVVLLTSCQLETVKSEEKLLTEKSLTSKKENIYKKGVRIAAVGDIMLGSDFPDQSRMPPDDGEGILSEAAPVLSAADIAFGNLEGPLTGYPLSEKCETDLNQCYAFRMPKRYAKHLRDAGFDVVSLANNHALDFGDEGRSDTRAALDSFGIKHAGSDRKNFSTTVIETNGKKIAFVGFAHNAVSPNVNDLETARALVMEAKNNADIVVVSFHGGTEGANSHFVPSETEMFFKEKRGNLPLFSRTVIDAGADLVLGHGPHVLRGMEIYKNRLIAYSLGNFATYGRFVLKGKTAESLILDIELTDEGEFVAGKIHPVKLVAGGIPAFDKTKSAIRTLQKLSYRNFRRTAPNIENDGRVSVR